MPPPKFIIGSLAFGKAFTVEEQDLLIPFMRELGVKEADSGPTWPLHAPGTAEQMIGAMLQYMSQDYIVDSRVECMGNGDGTMTADAIAKSLDRTLANLGLKKLNIFYCDRPDYKTPVAEQAGAIDKAYREGKFTMFGVCNFPIPFLEEWLQVCDEKGYVKPKVFQGMYNLLCRTYEETHFALLRKHGIRFFAHSPIAGGFLTGKVTFAADPSELEGTRWEKGPGNTFGNAYIACYDKPSMHDAVRTMSKLCEAHAIGLFDAAVRWSFYHSKLVGGPILSEKGDGVVLGAHNLSTLRKYVDAYVAGPLPEDLAKGLDGLWDGVREDASPLLAW
ncbi:Aldo/keto reductase [Lentithecium fluviatile CBS 122367]|uniref:Aldo/keto reductase n=1 Tax=Lentithecium fluviatile CBS 122367 TaxID=1168545 RepID=A0A6G1IIB3_9PLEO|nr:Aldo/keto reductase [Lentithecium fluviatile CBS 122367]